MRRPKHDNRVVPGCGFHHVAIRTSEWDRTIRFWTEALGFQVAIEWGEEPRRACMLDTGDGNYLEVFERDPVPGGVPSEGAILHFCFRADDCDAALERARAAGAEVTVEPKEVAIGAAGVPVRLAFFKGPNGEICELFQNEVL